MNQSFFRLLIRGEKRNAILLIGLAVLRILLSLTPPIAIQWYIDNVLLVGEMDMLWTAFMLIVCTTFLGILVKPIFDYLYSTMLYRQMNRTRSEMIRALLHSPFYRKKKDQYGYLFTRDVESLLHSGIEIIPDMVMSFLLSAGAMVYLGMVNIWFLIGVVLVTTLSLAPLYAINKKQGQLIVEAQQDEQNQTQFIKEFIDKPQFVKAIARIGFLSQRLQDLATKLLKSSLKRELNFRFYLVLQMLFQSIPTAFIFAYGGLQYFRGEMSIGQIVASTGMIPFIATFIHQISLYYYTMKEMQPRVERIAEVMSWPLETAVTKSGSTLPPDGAVTIRFEGVGLDNIVQNLSLELKSGQHYVVAGESGAGRSTFLSLLTGLQKPTQGRILLNDVPIDQWEPHSVRSLFGISLQDVFFFSGTIMSNLTAAVPRADEVDKALHLSCSDEFIGKLDQGLLAQLDENARNLSGGQRQRLSIARALMSKPKFLILDEATSALEPEVEQELLHRLYSESGCTIVRVTHNLSSVRAEDEIIWLDRSSDPKQTQQTGGTAR